MPATLHPHDPNCIFCKIIAGAIPCHRVYEDEQLLAFLDIGPLSRGHTLIVPRGHWVTLDQVPDQVSAAIGRLLPRLARAVIAATGTSDYNLLQNNGRAAHQVVGHVHFHIIPKFEQAGLGISWPAGKLDAEAAKQLVEAIAAALN